MEIDAGQAGALKERPEPDVGNAVRDQNVGQAGAVRERRVLDAGDRQAIDRVGDDYSPPNRCNL